MLSEQLIAGRVVIEFNFEPVVRVVAVGAVIAKKVLVHVVFEVTVNTDSRRITMFYVRCMTSIAVSILVFSK